MDEKISSCLDILGNNEYKKGLIGKMPMLGTVLGIGDETDAILKRADIDDQLRNILNRYIDVNSPTWRDFCTALEKVSDFNKIREKIETDHNSSEVNEPGPSGSKRSQLPSDDKHPQSKRPYSTREAEHKPGEGQDGRGVVKFALITANDNEWESAKFFMGTPMAECNISGFLKTYLHENFNFTDLFETDGTSVCTEEVFGRYIYVRVGGVRGVLTKCKMGSHVAGASGDTVATLLDTAKENNWPLEAVFIVGCCGCASVPEKNVGLGAVLIADPVIQYAGKFTDKGLEMPNNITNTFTTDQSWVTAFTIRNSMPRTVEKLIVENLKDVPFLSGDFLMKCGTEAEDHRKKNGFPLLGFEMEGAGACTMLNSLQKINFFKQKPPAILVVKGVCDSANSDKNVCADTAFFKETIANVDKDSRQQICTIMSMMVVFRAIKSRMADGAKPVVPSLSALPQ